MYQYGIKGSQMKYYRLFCQYASYCKDSKKVILSEEKEQIMKKTAAIVFVLCMIFIAGCGNEAGESYFNATVLEVYENSVLVEPFEGEEELQSADQFSVSTEVESTNEVPQMEKGTTIRIVYNGDIAESYPAQINTVFAIYLVDESGELIGNG